MSNSIQLINTSARLNARSTLLSLNDETYNQLNVFDLHVKPTVVLFDADVSWSNSIERSESPTRGIQEIDLQKKSLLPQDLRPRSDCISKQIGFDFTGKLFEEIESALDQNALIHSCMDRSSPGTCYPCNLLYRVRMLKSGVVNVPKFFGPSEDK